MSTPAVAAARWVRHRWLLAQSRDLGRAPRARKVRLGILVATVLVALAGVAASGIVAERDHEADVARTVGVDQARTRVERILSYSPQTADQDIAQAREAVSGPFADRFGGLLQQLVQPALSRGLSTRTKVVRASVTDAAPGEVDMLLFLDQTATAAGQPPQPLASSAHVHATEVAGQWLISDLTSG